MSDTSFSDARSVSDYYFYRAKWEPYFCIIPRRSSLTGYWLWGKAQRGEYVICGPGTEVVLSFYMTNAEHIAFNLRR